MATKPKAQTKVKGITLMTREKHRFDGYNVRFQKKMHGFRKYVSASGRGDGRPLEARQAAALDIAISERDQALAIVEDKRSWRGNSLTKAALNTITGMGFTVEIPVGA